MTALKMADAANGSAFTSQKIAATSASQRTNRIARPQFAAWRGASKFVTTLSPSFTVCEPSHDVVTFLRWALGDGDASGAAAPTFIVATVDFGRHMALCAEAQSVLTNPNAGGSSALSEALSFALLKTQFGVRLERTEMAIQYWTSSKITDFSVRVGHVRIGVSVTRACAFRGAFTAEHARHLLTKKLHGINDSTDHVIVPHAWKRQVLHIWTQTAAIADTLFAVYATLPAALRNDTLVMCSVTPAANEWLYFGTQQTLADRDAETAAVTARAARH